MVVALTILLGGCGGGGAQPGMPPPDDAGSSTPPGDTDPSTPPGDTGSPPDPPPGDTDPPTPPGDTDPPTPPGDTGSPPDPPPGDTDPPTPPGDTDPPTPPGDTDPPTPPGDTDPPTPPGDTGSPPDPPPGDTDPPTPPGDTGSPPDPPPGDTDPPTPPGDTGSPPDPPPGDTDPPTPPGDTGSPPDPPPGDTDPPTPPGDTDPPTPPGDTGSPTVEALLEEYERHGGLDMINAAAMHGRGGTGDGIVVALFDSGSSDHPELQGKYVYESKIDIECNTVEPGQTCTPAVIDAADSHGHGTFLAGLIVAPRDGEGIVGVAHEAQLASVAIFTGNLDDGQYASWLEGLVPQIDKMIELGALVTNNSWGTSLSIVAPGPGGATADEVRELMPIDTYQAYVDAGGVQVWGPPATNSLAFRLWRGPRPGTFPNWRRAGWWSAP